MPLYAVRTKLTEACSAARRGRSARHLASKRPAETSLDSGPRCESGGPTASGPTRPPEARSGFATSGGTRGRRQGRTSPTNRGGRALSRAAGDLSPEMCRNPSDAKAVGPLPVSPVVSPR